MKKTFTRVMFLAFGMVGQSYGSQLILNGGFESGTLANWTVTDETPTYGGASFFVSNSRLSPLSDLMTAGAENGTYYALADTGGNSAAVVLSQTFVVPSGAASVILSYGLFVNSGYNGPSTPASVPPASTAIDYNHIPSQYGIVSLLTAGTNLFSTGAGDLDNFYEGVDPGNNPNAYTNYSYNITPLVSGGGTFTIRFAEVANQDFLTMGLDNVSVVLTTVAVPEPAAFASALMGLGIVLWLRRAKQLSR
jgi:hypothetical protein